MKIPYCLSYDSDRYCRSCEPGYYLNANGGCEAIGIKGCLELKSIGECRVCRGKVLVEDGKCEGKKRCSDDKCQQCSVVRGRELCLKCIGGYTLNAGNACVKSNQWTQNCLYANRGNPDACAVCDLNYYYVNGRCVKSKTYSVDLGAKIAMVAGALLAVAFW